MSSDKDTQLQAYEDDSRVPCQYGDKCYQKNPQHHSKYKHPPKQKTVEKETEKIITGEKRTYPFKNCKKAQSKSPEKKFQKTHQPSEKNVHNLSPSPERTNVLEDNKKNDNEICSEKAETSNKEISNNCDAHKPTEYNATENISIADAKKIIMDLFLVEMPEDFFQFYKFCKSILKDNPLLACKSVCLKLVGPYDVLDGKIKNMLSSEDEKEKYLAHWRYYYDLPEFQTIVKCNDKEGLHFGYWRDDAVEKPVFVAKNRANVNGVFEPVAENIFGAIDVYLKNKLTLANPFEKTSIMRLHSQLKNFAEQHSITLEKNTANMRAREKRVVARTLHKAGIVVPYDKKTQLGYRDLAATDNNLQKTLKEIEKASTTEERKIPLAKLDEIMRLATIAADECDFGTCLELGHDLFSTGGIHVQTRALQMLSIAYIHLKRPQLLKILKAHLKNRKKECELSVI
ncbi:hypothetical protein PUN28_000694 [Cardiocondyla obscurior]